MPIGTRRLVKVHFAQDVGILNQNQFTCIQMEIHRFIPAQIVKADL